MYKVEFVELHGRFEFLIPAKMKGKSGITIPYQILLKVACNIELHSISECFYSSWKWDIYSSDLFIFSQVNNMGRKKKNNHNFQVGFIYI